MIRIPYQAMGTLAALGHENKQMTDLPTSRGDTEVLQAECLTIARETYDHTHSSEHKT
jgi:hypothetical protein